MLYVIVAIIIIFVLYLIFSKGSGSDYGELLISCDNDKALAERLINLEKESLIFLMMRLLLELLILIVVIAVLKCPAI